MALAINKENYFLHKLHSLTGIIPVGFYMVQHLTLNSFALAGPAYFNGVVNFFEAIPKHVFYPIKYGLIWLPLIFHAIYGMFIIARAEPNYKNSSYKWRENRMYSMQRWSGVLAFLFLCYHMAETSIRATMAGNTEIILYAAWNAKFTQQGVAGYLIFAVYLIGILASCYHLCYGIWNFCIRWGITVSDASQARMQKFATGAFVVLTLLGWGALGGFLIHDPKKGVEPKAEEIRVSAPVERKAI